MQFIAAQNVGTTPKRGSRHDIRYIAGAGEITTHNKVNYGHMPQRGSQELLSESRRGSGKKQKQVNQVVGLMDENLEALMVREHKMGHSSRRQSGIEGNGSEWHHRSRKTKR